MSDQINLLPPNATHTEIAVDEGVDLALELSASLQTLWDSRTCPTHLLPWLAWTYSVDVWHSRWGEAKRRDVLAASLATHRQKGTVAAVKQAVAALGSRVRVIEWFEPEGSGDPHTVLLEIYVNEILLDGAALITPELLADLTATVSATAPARVHFTIEIGVGFHGDLALAGALRRPVQLSSLIARTAAEAELTGILAQAAILPRPVSIVSVNWEEANA